MKTLGSMVICVGSVNVGPFCFAVGACNKFDQAGVAVVIFKAVTERRQENMAKKWGLVGAFMCEFNLKVCKIQCYSMPPSTTECNSTLSALSASYLL